MKRTLAILLAVLMMGGLVACGKTDAPAPADPAPAVSDTQATEPVVEKQTINLWAFTDEVPKMVRYYLSQNPEFAEKYEIKETIIATDGGGYQTALDQALAAGGEDAPDIYCAEAAFILKYAQGDAAKYAGTYEDLGIDVAAKTKEADIAQYTIDIATRPEDGKLVGLGYQATGGAFIYRASIAEEVFGSSEPAVVEEAIGAGTGNWDKFWEAAAALKEKGHPIVSGDGDVWHAVENSSSQGWINEDNELVIDEKRAEFFGISKVLKDNAWHNDTQDWTDAWYADMAGTSETPAFGFFGPAWLVNYTIAPQANNNPSFGDWRVCAPPVGFFWGGTWLLSSKEAADVKDGVAELIEWITLDCTKDGLQYAWANGTVDWDEDPSTVTSKDCVASGVVMGMSEGSVELLGGQDMFPAFIAGNAYANGKCLTQYDETINGYFRDQVRQYTAGEKDLETAVADFIQQCVDNLGLGVAEVEE